MATTVLVSLACVAGLLGLVAGVLALRTLAGLRRSVRLLSRTVGNDTLADVTAQHIQLAGDAATSVVALRAHVDERLAQTESQMSAAVAGLQAQLAQTLATDRGDVDVRVEQGRQRLQAEAEAQHAHLAHERAALLGDVELARRNAGADQVSAQDLVRATLEEVTGIVTASLRRVALVRFDAFDDLSGRLSFCLALLDGRGNGIALTSLAGRSDTRLYAKPIAGGTAEGELTPEERQAVKAALAV